MPPGWPGTPRPTCAGWSACSRTGRRTRRTRRRTRWPPPHIEGGRGGPLTAAADGYDRAARALYGRAPARTTTGDALRAAARNLVQLGRATRDEPAPVATLVAQLAQLVDAVAELRAAQAAAAQMSAFPPRFPVPRGTIGQPPAPRR
jgi:hypothetical protein